MSDLIETKRKEYIDKFYKTWVENDLNADNLQELYTQWDWITKTLKEVEEKNKYSYAENDVYCKVCGTCGYIDCCGVDSFLDEHVKGKTNCLHEADMIDEIKRTREE